MGSRALIFDDQLVQRGAHGLAGTEPFALFIDALSANFAHTTVLARCATTQSSPSYPLRGVEFLPLPRYASIAALCRQFPLHAPAIVRTLRTGIREADVAFLHWPHPISVLTILLARLSRRRPAICLFARTAGISLVAQRYAGISKVLAVSCVWLLEQMLRWMQHDAIVFAAGSHVYEIYRRRFPNTREVSFEYLPRDETHLQSCSEPNRVRAGLRLLYVGRLEPEKGVSYLLRAVRQSLDSGELSLELDVVGSGSEERVLRSLVQALALENVVRFHGHVPFGDPLFSFYRDADLVVIPSCSEGLPHVMLEAMWFGVPVIATAVGAVPRIIRNGENGWLVPAKSSAELSETIRVAAASTEKRCSAARVARLDVDALLRLSTTSIILDALESWRASTMK